MSRRPATKVTRERVFETCERIFIEGAAPTGAAVQAALGGGSPNGIYRYVNEWYADLRRRFDDLRDAAERPHPPDIPKVLWDALMPVWHGLYEAAHKSAEAALEPERRRLAQLLADAQQARELAAKDLAEQQRERETLTQQRDSALSAVEGLKTRLALLEGHHRSDAGALAEARDTIAALNEQLERDRAAFTDQLTAMRADHLAQLRDRDAAHERETARLMQQLDRERVQFKDREREIMARLTAAEAKAQDKTKEVIQLHQRLATLQAQLTAAQSARTSAAAATATRGRKDAPPSVATKKPKQRSGRV